MRVYRIFEPSASSFPSYKITRNRKVDEERDGETERIAYRAGSSMRLVRLKPQGSGPGPRQGPGPPGTTKIYKVGPLWAPKFLERKYAVF